MDPTPQWFWDNYRRRLRSTCTEAILNDSPASNVWAKTAAFEVCKLLDPNVTVHARIPGLAFGEAPVTWEEPLGVTRTGWADVAANLPGRDRFLIAYEHELAAVGFGGPKNTKNWREEFVKLCGVKADFKVLSSYFLARTGPQFPTFLRGQLDSMKCYFRPDECAQWLLVFGSDWSSKDPQQPWLAFTLKQDFSLEPLPDGVGGRHPFRPRLVCRGQDSRQEE